jgi:hypothetical protein
VSYFFFTRGIVLGSCAFIFELAQPLPKAFAQTQSYSNSHWSGLALISTQTAKTYTSVQSTWIVPAANYAQYSDSPASESSSTWIGIGSANEFLGGGDSTLIQLGTEQDVYSNSNPPQYSAWYETVPPDSAGIHTPLPSQYKVAPGDLITASIYCIANCVPNSTQTWLISMTNSTENWSWSTTISYMSSLGSVEWIEEASPSCNALGQCNLAELPNYGSLAFGNVIANGVDPDLSTAAVSIAMVNQSQSVYSSVCAPVGGTQITLVYGNNACPAPRPCQTLSTVSDLQAISQNLSGRYCLNNDIDASTIGNFNPLGGNTNQFTGVFEGQGHTISNLTIEASGYVGLFGYIGTAGTVRNVSLTNVNIRDEEGAGGALAGQNNGTVENVSVSGQVVGSGDTGALVGDNLGEILISSSTASVESFSGNSVGGLVGSNDQNGFVSQSCATGAVNGNSHTGTVGGFVGSNENIILQSYASGNVSGVDNQGGGFVGENIGIISNSYATGSITGQVVGGFAGASAGATITSSYSTGLVTRGAGFVNYVGPPNTGANFYATYWDIDTSGQTTDSAATGLTTTEFKSGLPSDFDPSIWGSSATFNNGYPYLLWQKVAEVTIASTPNPSSTLSTVTFIATVTANSGAPSGTVIFLDGANQIGSSSLSNRTAVFPIASLSPGGHFITAVYGGDANFPTSASSSLLQTVNTPVLQTLSVTLAGNGMVVSSPSGISCTSTCSSNFATGTEISLSETAALGWSFSGWSGACTGVTGCAVTMNAGESVTATFTQVGSYLLSVAVAGNGTVTSSVSGDDPNPINCPSTCGTLYASGATVTLAATPSGGASFIGWGGACSGSGPTCSLSMNSEELVTAVFSTSGGGSPASRTWVSGLLGNDTNPCTRNAPCLTFAAALAQTAAGGEIDILDPGDFGPVTIGYSITIDNEGAFEGGVMPSSASSGITINANANDVITLHGLAFNGSNGSATSGVIFARGARLNVKDCVFQGFSGAGIAFSPGIGSASVTKMVIEDATVIENAPGMLIKPTSGVGAEITITNTKFDQNNGDGVRVDSTGGSGSINVAIADSSLSFNIGNGLSAVSGLTNVSVDIARAVVGFNGVTGIQANQSGGGAATVTVGSGLIRGNVTGVQAQAGAVVLSYGNNVVRGNVNNGSFAGTAGLH